jgi:5-carboxymethyl-2-hydroxymuconate isomerase
MPHLYLETTADLPENADIPDILSALAEALSGLDTVKPDRVRVYHCLRSNWVMGKGGPAGFAHVTLAVFEGRSEEWRAGAAQALMTVLKKFFAASLEAKEVSVTVEVRQMEQASYLRQV